MSILDKRKHYKSVRISDDILYKNGELSDQEYFKVRNHHEKMDGSAFETLQLMKQEMKDHLDSSIINNFIMILKEELKKVLL